ncbi:MAG: TonB-dependent receptor [Saprospiraceae bacterium]|nr:TonB-dependent receptor [Saprospiraceae bacterium]
MLLSLNLADAQVFTITVESEEGGVLPGVQIYSDDLKVVRITDADGQAQLPDLDGSVRFNISYVGFAIERKTVAQLRKAQRVVLVTALHELDLVEVVGRYGQSSREVTQRLQTISREQMELTNPQTSADALQQHAGVFVQKSQMGGGSPIIRGFEANKILLVVDGVRMNNAIYRNGHLQNAITIGGTMLERIEVLYGPGSLGYGSDALGGVIHFRTLDPVLSQSGRTEVSGSAFLRHATANNEKTGQVQFQVGGRKLSALTSVAYSDFGDLRTGSNRDDRFPQFGTRPDFQVFEDGLDKVVINEDPDVQVGTAYHQYDILQKFKYRPGSKWQLVANLQYSNSGDVPRYDNLSERRDGTLRWSEWYYGPQKRFMSKLKVNVFDRTTLFDNGQLIVAWQAIGEDRVTRRFAQTAREYQEEEVRVFSVTADFTKSLDDRQIHALEYGIDFQSDDVTSVAFAEDIVTRVRSEDILTRYPDGESGMRSAGAYLKYRWHNAAETKRFEAGLRLANANTTIRSQRTDIISWPEDFTEGVENENTALTGALSWQGHLSPSLRYRLMASSAYRVPNIDDLAKIRVQGGNVLVPNLELTPERAYTFEASLSQTATNLIPLPNSSLQVDVTGYYTRLSDAIIRANFHLPDGDTLLSVQGEPLRVQANIHAENAYVYGVSANLKLVIDRSWELTSSFNYLKGESQQDGQPDQPLAHIPPNYGKVALQYQTESWTLQLSVRYNGMKPIDEFALGSSDNEDYATPIGSLAWATLNTYATYRITESLSVSVALENIFDKHYRLFSSGVSAPGRNLVVGVRGSF